MPLSTNLNMIYTTGEVDTPSGKGERNRWGKDNMLQGYSRCNNSILLDGCKPTTIMLTLQEIGKVTNVSIVPGFTK